MAKTDLPLDKVALWRCFSPPGSPAWLETPINGWDTETSNGDPIVLAYAWEGERGAVVQNERERVDSRTIFKKLTHHKARSACNVWFNLDFDANVILAHLPKSTVSHISMFGQDDWNGYRIVYIAGKLLSITDEHRNKCQHFDVANIFFQTGGSLDGALQAWLGRRKRNDKVDVTRFDDPEYIRAHWRDIVEYGGADAEDVRDLWRGFVNVAEPLEIPCGRPYSTGYLAEQRYNVEFGKPKKQKPGFVNKALQEFAWRSYFGGRFEVIERGTIEDVISYDINSAYPAVLRTLPDPATVWWERVERPSLQTLEQADYGFIRAIVSTAPERPLQPFAVRKAGRLTFPTLDRYPVTVTLPEFLYAARSGLLREATITEAWVGRADRGTVYPYAFIDDIYRKRQELKAEGNDKAQAVLKIVINSLYGKLAQLTESLGVTPGDGTWRKHWRWQPIEMFPPHLREWLETEGIEVHRQTKAGSYFNPVLASYVTASVRLQLLKTVVGQGFEDDIILLATDSVTLRAGVADRFDSSLLDDRELGRWGVDDRGRMFLVGSGVYELETSDGKVKSRTRGFEPGLGVFQCAVDDATLRQAAESARYDTEKGEWVLPISNTRPLKIRQALWQGIDLAEVGRFKAFPRGLSAGMDVKRLWPNGRAVSYSHLLESSERSDPLRWGVQ